MKKETSDEHYDYEYLARYSSLALCLATTNVLILYREGGVVLWLTIQAGNQKVEGSNLGHVSDWCDHFHTLTHDAK